MRKLVSVLYSTCMATEKQQDRDHMYVCKVSMWLGKVSTVGMISNFLQGGPGLVGLWVTFLCHTVHGQGL